MRFSLKPRISKSNLLEALFEEIVVKGKTVN